MDGDPDTGIQSRLRRLRLGHGDDSGGYAANRSQLGDIYSTPLTVTISDSTPGAVIYVTSDGPMSSLSSLSSPVYHGPFSLTQAGQVQVQAIAAARGYSISPFAVAAFTLQ